MKKDSGLLDVAIGSFDRAKGCKRNGNFLLNKLSAKYERKKLGLYRDDGLTIFKNDSGLTTQCNGKVVNFLDVTLNVETQPTVLI